MDPDFIKSLTGRFQVMMANKEKNTQQNSFVLLLQSLSQQYLGYTPALLDQSLETIDLAKIYEVADAMATSSSDLGYQDCVIKSLLKYMKEDFFTWVNAPNCSQCGSETTGLGSAAPNTQERAKGAGRVELYRCKESLAHVERFPRYDSPGTLLTWRKGRCGEWANCFTMLCLALGSRARWVWNAEDHVWTEVFSTTLNRWVHCDPCENSWDAPLIYSVGWGKKMSYCIGFSATGAQDVTRRYVRSAEHTIPRNRAPENALTSEIQKINTKLRAPLESAEIEALEAEDRAEEKELQEFLRKPEPTATAETRSRESGNAEWKRARNEDGASES